MKGVQIFSHSLRQVMNNLPAAVRVSGVLYLALAVLGLILDGLVLSGSGMNPADRGDGMGFGALLMLAIPLVAGIWIAVAWHRYVLLAEDPGALLPPFAGGLVWAYFVNSLLIGIVLIVGGMIIGMVGGMIIGMVVPILMQGGEGIGIRWLGIAQRLLITVFIEIPIIFVGLRLAAALPGAALGVRHPFMAGWQATKGEWRPILGLSVIMGIAFWVINLIGVFVFGGFGLMAQIWQIISGWPVMMVGLSILTTLYGHYVEKRPLV